MERIFIFLLAQTEGDWADKVESFWVECGRVKFSLQGQRSHVTALFGHGPVHCYFINEENTKCEMNSGKER